MVHTAWDIFRPDSKQSVEKLNHQIKDILWKKKFFLIDFQLFKKRKK